MINTKTKTIIGITITSILPLILSLAESIGDVVTTFKEDDEELIEDKEVMEE